MRIDKFTQKMQEAMQASQDIAAQHNQQEITNDHFLIALLDQTDGVTRPLLEKLGVSVDNLRSQVEADVNRRPQVHGSTDVRIGSELRQTLDAAEKELVIVPGATHLFEEPGALEEVARLASGWFTRHLRRSVPAGHPGQEA